MPNLARHWRIHSNTSPSSMRFLLRSLCSIVVALLLAAGLIALRSCTLTTRQPPITTSVPVAVELAAAAERLAGALRIATVSPIDAVADLETFASFHAYLERSYPRTHAELERELISGASLLYTWPGRDRAAAPIMLLAHQDVVPAALDTLAQWTHPPFAGVIAEGYVWGRGALDDKGSLIAILEAVESLLAAGYVPQRTLLLGFGHDEELGGAHGMRAIAAHLMRHGIRPEFVLDEGLVVTEGIVADFERPVALIGIAEKGLANYRIEARAAPGHSSMPAGRTAVDALTDALLRIRAHPPTARLGAATDAMFDALAPEARGVDRIVLANRDLLAPLLIRSLDARPSTRALVRSTIATTVLRAGAEHNVVPASATAWVNVRIAPGDTSASLRADLERVVDDAAVEITLAAGFSEPSPAARTDCASYRLLARTLREVFPDAIVAPGLVIGGTDARHLVPIAADVYRFSPVRMRSEDLRRLHGIDERLALSNLAEMIRFYRRVIALGTTDVSAAAARPTSNVASSN
jgi:carboxypeptidase PM20D1